ncbi:MAG: hypothetical protein ACJAV2_005104 [Myxococcota bacterium]|jgi:hypothetical protein
MDMKASDDACAELRLDFGLEVRRIPIATV